MGPDLGEDDVDQGPGRGRRGRVGGGVPGDGATVSLSALVGERGAARGGGDEGPDRKRGGEGRRDGTQREAGSRWHSRDRVRRANAATPARGANPLLAGGADAADAAKA